MANRRKTEAEKTKPVNITLSGDIRSKLTQKSIEMGISASQLISELLKALFDGKIEYPIDEKVVFIAPAAASLTPDQINELLERVSRLEREEEIRKSKTTQTSLTQSHAIAVSPVAPIEVSPVQQTPHNPPTVSAISKVGIEEMKSIGHQIRVFIANEKAKGVKVTVKGVKDLYGVDVSDLSKWENGTGSLSREKYNQILAVIQKP